MGKKLTTEKFIQKAKEIHGDIYDYSKVNYINIKTKVCIICPKHGEFLQSPDNHLHGQKCPKCSKVYKRNKEDFINESKIIHLDKYNYDKVNYINTTIKVCIICPEHGEFWQTPKMHLQGQDCPKCKNKKISDKLRSNKEEFIKKANIIHNNKYNYSKFDYQKSSIKSIIICPEHGEFLMSLNNHLRGEGCLICAKDHLSTIKRKPYSQFIQESNLIHYNKYEYPEINYKSLADKIKIHCTACNNDFYLNASSHLYQKQGCPYCSNKESKGERFVRHYLDSINIKYNQWYSLKQDEYSFIFDFYIKINEQIYIIEYNGIQHYKPINLFGGESRFQWQQERDLKLRQFCDKNNYKLLEIKYDLKDDEIKQLINKFLYE